MPKARDLFGLSAPAKELVRELWRIRDAGGRWSDGYRTLDVVDGLRAVREPGCIGELRPVGLSANTEVRVESRAAIRELAELVPMEQLPVLDARLRQDYGYFGPWNDLKPEDVVGLHVQTLDDAVFVCLIASHRNGYVRAEAVKRLADDR